MEKVEARRRAVALLKELREAGLLEYSLSSEVLDGPEPHVEVWSSREQLGREAPVTVSPLARKLWEHWRAERRSREEEVDAGE